MSLRAIKSEQSVTGGEGARTDKPTLAVGAHAFRSVGEHVS
jgi:hypothetical protein